MERKDQRVREDVQGRGAERGVSGSEPAAVSASLLLLSSSASTALGKAASSSQLPLTVVSKQQGSSSSERTLTNRGPASAQEEAQHAQSRPQHNGLLARGVRLLKNMGNQEAKQKKGGGGAAGRDVCCDDDADEREVDKKSKKSSKTSKGGEQNGKKKSKSESKGSVFSGMKIRKSFSKAKGLSKDDMLEDGRSAHFDKAGLKPGEEASLSADEMGMLDGEGDLSYLNTDSHQSIVDEMGRKTSSGSDADHYSFHSAAAENEDLLFDIQQAIRNQCVASDRVLEMVTGHLSEEFISGGSKVPENASHHMRNLAEEVFSPPESRVIPISRNSSGPGSLSESGPPSSAPDTERSSGSLFPKTNSTYSFPDTTATTTSYESADEPQDDLESPFLHPQLSQGNRAAQSEVTSVPCVRLEPTGAGAGPIGVHKSVSSMDLSMEREEVEESRRWDFLSLKRRKSSMSISQLTPDSPNASQPRRPSSNSPSTVKLYPPVHPSYVKTTTRQLTSPIGSPITSPNVPRKDAISTSVGSSGGQGFRRRKQRSCSIAGPFSVSADWSTEVDELRGRQSDGAKFSEPETPEKGYTEGTYWTLGSRRAHYGRQTSSTTTTTTAPYLDVFSGESHMKQVINVTKQIKLNQSDIKCC